MGWSSVSVWFVLMLVALVATFKWHGFIWLALLAGLVLMVMLAVAFVTAVLRGTYRGKRYPYE